MAGMALTAAFAPHDFWPLALLAPAALIWLWHDAASAREGAWLGFLFGLGHFASGTWWLFISIHVLGQAPVWVAMLVMGALLVMMSAYMAGLGYAIVRWLPARSPVGWMLGIPGAWMFVEWWRGWFLSGFPWLSLGYSQIDTWLAGFAPIGGVYLLSALVLVSAGALVSLIRGGARTRLIATAVLVVVWTAGLALRKVEWTTTGAARQVAVLQGAISQDMKWLESNQQAILDTYADLHKQALGASLIVWPESALPDVANNLAPYISSVWSSAHRSGSAVIMGVMRVDARVSGAEIYYNSVLALDEGEPAFYDKRHLVPFGEYFPVPSWIRSWLRLMSLPYSDFTPGANEQPAFDVAGLKVAANICYEDAYPAALMRAARTSQLLVTVTNDAWFGRSGARYQHLQIARMRAAEARRHLVRAANDGVSALVGPHGEVEAAAAEFRPGVLRGAIRARSGTTPYLVVGNTPIVGVATLVLAIMATRKVLARRRRNLRSGTTVYQPLSAEQE
jgi:apolipoprotein N-acyltransferase